MKGGTYSQVLPNSGFHIQPVEIISRDVVFLSTTKHIQIRRTPITIHSACEKAIYFRNVPCTCISRTSPYFLPFLKQIQGSVFILAQMRVRGLTLRGFISFSSSKSGSILIVKAGVLEVEPRFWGVIDGGSLKVLEERRFILDMCGGSKE